MPSRQAHDHHKKTGAIEVEKAMPYDDKVSTPNSAAAHDGARHYLVPFLQMHRVVEYDKDLGDWSYAIRSLAAIRLHNGTADHRRRRQADPGSESQGETVWESARGVAPEYRWLTLNRRSSGQRQHILARGATAAKAATG